MKQLFEFKKGEIIRFKTRYNLCTYTGKIHHYKQKSGNVFVSVRTESNQFIQSEITEIL